MAHPIKTAVRRWVVVFLVLFIGVFQGTRINAQEEKSATRQPNTSLQELDTGGTTELVSIPLPGQQLVSDTNGAIAISDDGHFIAFSSLNSTFVANDTNNNADVFVRNMLMNSADSIKRVSVDSHGNQTPPSNLYGNSGYRNIAISANGRYVAFESLSESLVDNDNNLMSDVFVHDTFNGETERVSIRSVSSGGDGGNGPSGADGIAISADGRYVVFESYASDFDSISPDTNDAEDVFVHDRLTDETTRVSVNSAGIQGDSDSGGYGVAISDDGRYVAFLSKARNLIENDLTQTWDVFVKDRSAYNGTVIQASVATDGTQANSYSKTCSPSVAMTGDGKYVVFSSYADNLVENDNNHQLDVFLREFDPVHPKTIRISVDKNGNESNGMSCAASISSDGRYISFLTYANNLVENDNNNAGDVIVYDRATRKPNRVSVAYDGMEGNRGSGTGIISANGHHVAFESISSNLVSQNTNHQTAVFLHTWGNQLPSGNFFDLPFRYNYVPSLAIQNWNQPYGRINSWFDHDLPNYGLGHGILISDGTSFTTPQGTAGDGLFCYGHTSGSRYCYDGHDGLDFSGAGVDVLAAADGVVVDAKCGAYGNQIVIKNNNGYFTLYGHLDISNGGFRKHVGDTVFRGEVIGISGGTGQLTDQTGHTYCGSKYVAHIHFGVYYDDGDGNWEGDSVDKQVDPSGFFGDADPWEQSAAGGVRSYWLWNFDRLNLCFVPHNQNTTYSDPSGDIALTIPAEFFPQDTTLELLREPEVAAPSATLRNAGYSFWLRLSEYFSGSEYASTDQASSKPLQPSIGPLAIDVTYSDSAMKHLNEAGINLFLLNEATGEWSGLNSTTDVTNNVVHAQTETIGHFSLQAPLKCPADEFITDDTFYGAIPIQPNGSLAHRLFDIQDDEDWFEFDALQGAMYVMETLNLAQGVNAKMELYDHNGVSILANGSENGSKDYLHWIAPEVGTYFLRATGAQGSNSGCTALYDLKVTQLNSIYLPLLRK